MNEFKYESKDFKEGSVSITVHSIEHHRNGISGEGFYALIFTDSDESPSKKVATVFDSNFTYDSEDNLLGIPKFNSKDWNNPTIAVLDIAMLAEGNVGRANMWRGDYYVGVINKAVLDYQKQLDDYYQKEVI